MSQFMILAQYSVKVQSDMSPQAQFLPMVTLYFMLGLSYSFVSLIWFIIANNWTVKNNIPPYVSKFASYVKKVLFWIFDEPPFWEYFTFKKSNDNEKNKLFEKPDEAPRENSSVVKIELNDSKSENRVKIRDAQSKCNYCNFCEKCQKDKDKEKDKKKKKDATESDISALNYFACLCMILIELAGNLTVWLMISNPFKGF
jgi:hypothetical protein